MSDQVQETITTRQLRIVDSEDRPRILLGTSQTGDGIIAVYDSEGTQRVELGMSSDEVSTIQFKGPDGHIRAGALVQGENSTIALYGLDGRIRVALALTAEGDAQIALSDGSGAPHVVLTVDAAGNPTIGALDAYGMLRRI